MKRMEDRASDSRLSALLSLFTTFFRIGLFTFGGGYAMISLIEHEIGERRRWVSLEELEEVFAIAESTPGPIAVNSATYVGYRRAGTAGGVCATAGVVLPSFIIIYVISLCLDRFMAFRAVASAFRGIQVAVAFLIIRAGIRMLRRMPRRGIEIACCALAAILVALINLAGLRVSTVLLILLGCAVGLLFRRAAAAGKEVGK